MQSNHQKAHEAGYPSQQAGYPSQQQHSYPSHPTTFLPHYSTQQAGVNGESVNIVMSNTTQHPGVNSLNIPLPNQAQISQISFIVAIIFSCGVFWCCGFLFGLIGFILAMAGMKSASNGDSKKAKRLLIASFVMSAVGVVLVIIAAIVVGVLVGTGVIHSSTRYFSYSYGYYY